ncbi:MAG: ABC transporter permease, partial [Thermoanaerobaculia bacterium]
MFLRLLFESFRRGRRAKLLALAAVTLGTLAATALGVLLLGSGDQLSGALATYGANLRVVPAEGTETLPVAELQGLEESFWRNNLTAVAPLLEVRVRWSADRHGAGATPRIRSGQAGAHPPRASAGEEDDHGTGPSPAAVATPEGRVAPVVGTWFDRELAHWRTGLPATRPSLPVEGRWPGDAGGSAGDELPEVALGRRLAASLDIGPGDAVALELGERRARARVVGVVAGGGEEEDAGFAPLTLVQDLAGRPGRIGAAEISALTVPEPSFQRRDPEAMSPEEYDAWYCTAYPSAVALSVDEVLPSGRAEVVRQVAGTAGAVLLRLRVVLGVLAGVALLGAFLGVASSMAATVQGRRGELALLAALGSDRGWIVRFFLAEAALLGLAGGLLGGLAGLAAGRFLAAALFELPADWHLVLLPFAAVLGLAVAVAGTARPLWSVLRLPPARLGQHVAVDEDL